MVYKWRQSCCSPGSGKCQEPAIELPKGLLQQLAFRLSSVRKWLIGYELAMDVQ